MPGFQVNNKLPLQLPTEPVIHVEQGYFVNRKVTSYNTKPMLRLLEPAPALKKPLKDRNIALIPEKEARGVLPEYQRDRLIPAPKAQDVKLGKSIASGSFGTVYEAKPSQQTNLSDTPTTLQKSYVVKVQADAMEDDFESAEEEVVLQNSNTRAPKITDSKVMEYLEHKGIEKLHTSVMERKMTSLRQALHTQPNLMKSSMARNFGRQILRQIRENHDNNIIHRDIKPDNILMDHRGQVCLTDYGIAQKLSPGEILTDCSGSPSYICPEAYNNRGQDLKADIWSMGVVMYELLAEKRADLISQDTNGHLFFDNTKHSRLIQSIHNGPQLSHAAKSLLKDMLNTDPYARPSAQEVLTHPFFHPEKLSFAELQSEHIHLFESLAHHEQQRADIQGGKKNGSLRSINRSIKHLQSQLKTVQEKMHQMESVSDRDEQRASARIKKR
ncbi:Serine/threonine-protein kinase PrkC [invertebrate metagenome]|uniref:Serine/threonine-protein kinase PrkC n=1 Tax=invertebrate metagenome TaxID=1711999 RepID=A0A2H9T7M2_9ZZZZ